jgi:hypothetical protein
MTERSNMAESKGETADDGGMQERDAPGMPPPDVERAQVEAFPPVPSPPPILPPPRRRYEVLLEQKAAPKSGGTYWKGGLLAATPLFVALAAGWINCSIQETAVSKDYVKMAVDILARPKTASSAGKDDEALRSWAIDVLEKQSPVGFNADVRRHLESGDIRLPDPTPTFTPAVVASPRGNELDVARQIERDVQDRDFEAAVERFPLLRASHFSGVGFSAYPDAAFAFDQAGDEPGALRVLDLLEGRLKDDAAKGHGYLAPGRPPRDFIRKDFESFSPMLKSQAVRERMQAIQGAL